MILIKTKKILLAIILPWKWTKLYEQIRLYATNIIKYRNFSFDLNSKRFWDEELAKFNDFWRNENYHHILDLLPQNNAFSLLDIGCAIGDGCELIQEKFPKAKITGFDISDVGIEKAKEKIKNAQYFIFDILKDPIPKKYDYITIIETLEHFDNPFAIVDKCLKHVKKTLIISTPYSPEYSGRRYVVHEHRYCFNEKTFENYNCRVVRVTEHGKDQKEIVIIYEIRP